MTSAALTDPTPGPLEAERLLQAQVMLERSLGAWGLSSMVTGAVLVAAGRRGRGPGWVAEGHQHLAWGGVDAALAGWGYVRRLRTGPFDPATATESARKLRRLLRVNVGLDVLYVSAGAMMLLRPRQVLGLVPSTAEVVRPVGAAVMVQGAFLLFLDATAAARLRSVAAPTERS